MRSYVFRCLLVVCFSVLCCHVAGFSHADGGTVLFLVAPARTHPVEYAVPRRLLEAGGYRVQVACTSPAATDMNGKAIPVDLGLHEVDPAGYCAVAVIGGYRIYQYERHPEVERILRGVLASGGYVSGICAGSYVLGRAGLLTGKKVTGPKPHKLRRSGARYVGGPVQRDGRIITAKGPAAAEQFGEVLLNSVSGPLATMY